MPFPRAFARNETQTANSNIWIQIANSISYHSNRYTERATCILLSLA